MATRTPQINRPLRHACTIGPLVIVGFPCHLGFQICGVRSFPAIENHGASVPVATGNRARTRVQQSGETSRRATTEPPHETTLIHRRDSKLAYRVPPQAERQTRRSIYVRQGGDVVTFAVIIESSLRCLLTRGFESHVSTTQWALDQPTALVHEAWLRLVQSKDQMWKGRGHFLAAAAEAMRRILIDHARRKNRVRRTPARNWEGFFIGWKRGFPRSGENPASTTEACQPGQKLPRTSIPQSSRHVPKPRSQSRSRMRRR